VTHTIRHIEPSDHHPVLAVVGDWWGGRSLKHLLPKLFFVHFQPTSFILEQDGKMRGFLIGFVSDTDPRQSYIHFVGIDPNCRAQGFGRSLYNRFFETVKALGCIEVQCITSPVNKGSIGFHTRMGFEILPGDTQVDGIAATSNYDGQGGTRVQFRKILTIS
jgi:ribosomal protein S18 acetylase RimI-like enzyme